MDVWALLTTCFLLLNTCSPITYSLLAYYLLLARLLLTSVAPWSPPPPLVLVLPFFLVLPLGVASSIPPVSLKRCDSECASTFDFLRPRKGNKWAANQWYLWRLHFGNPQNIGQMFDKKSKAGKEN